MKLDKNQQAFFALVRAGLWEKEVRLLPFGTIDYKEVYRLAEEQSVVGLVAAGLEQVVDATVPKDDIIQFVGRALQLEQRNTAMNEFVASLVERLRGQDVCAVLVKGQGIAQCYEKPLWRASGDVDLFLDGDSFDRAALFLPTLARSVEENRSETKHFAMNIGLWEVELHGTLRSQLGRKIDRVIDDVQRDTFDNKRFRVWANGGTDVLLPAHDNDVFFVFTHILQHFFRGGIGLRQICDWCRLLWTFRSVLNRPLLQSRLQASGLLPEWKAFAALAVGYLGMPEEAMPLYSSRVLWKRKADVILSFVVETGNFGHNRDTSYQRNCPYIVRKTISLWRHTWDGIRHFFVFPDVSVREWLRMLKEGLKRVERGR